MLDIWLALFIFLVLFWFAFQQMRYKNKAGITYTKNLRLKRKVMPIIKKMVRYPWEIISVSEVGYFDPKKSPYRIDLKIMNSVDIRIKTAKVTFDKEGNIGEETLSEVIKSVVVNN